MSVERRPYLLLASEQFNIIKMEVSQESSWFQTNVFFIFSSGCIFSDDDKKRLDGILTLFKPNNKSNKYLMNKVLYTNYENDKMKSIENKLAIVNGNYHVCAVVGVYDTADLNDAPETTLARHGLISCHFLWEDIQTTILEYIKKYGYENEVEETDDEDKTAIHRKILDVDIDTEKVKKNADTILELSETIPLRGRKQRPKHIRKNGVDAIRNDYYNSKL